MCTVTIVPFGDSQFRLVCNRDERLERPRAKPPQLVTKGRRTVVYPIDPLSLGTWVGVNDTGLAVALLNRTQHGLELRDPRWLRRGGIVPRLLAESDGVDAVTRTVGAITLDHFAPFTIVAVCRQQVVALSSDGHELSLQRAWLAAPMLFTSSSLGDERVEGERRRLFQECLGADFTGWLGGQARFHGHQWPDRPEISVRMERRGAATMSRSTIDVSRHRLRFRYEDLRPDPQTARVA
jgi:hypothetical protein